MDYSEKIAEAKDGNAIKHYSHLRENLVSWLPFRGDEKVLEVGAECGALTGCLLKMAGSVTAIEESEEWNHMNAERHSYSENLSTLTGECRQLLQGLQEKYDYIFLVSDQARKYMKTDKEAVSFLQFIKEYLTENGSIVIAMPNRLGLKYWAGYAEDNYGVPFEGLEGYRHSDGIRTYSWKEWQKILSLAGDFSVNVFFPEPDCYYPMTIYSEERQPRSGELKQSSFNFDHIRVQLFEDSAVFDSIIQNELYREFADAFLFVLQQKEIQQKEKLLYTKYSNDRAESFAIRTDIVKEDDGIRYVKKIPVTEGAKEHVLHLKTLEYMLEELYRPYGMLPNHCEIKNGAAYFEFLQGKTLEEELDQYLSEKQYDILEKRLFAYLELVEKIHSSSRFSVTEQFRKVFGDNIPEADEKCSRVSNIDLIVGNVILGEEYNWIIDYEWTFDFPIPEKYLRYRILHYYLESDSKRNVLKDLDFYGKANISAAETVLFEKMEQCFQRYLNGTHRSLSQIYQDVNPGILSVQSLLANKLQDLTEQKLQIFYEDGKGFREENSVKMKMSEEGFCHKILIPDKVRAVRLDPGERPCALRIHKLNLNGKKIERYATNGFQCEENLWYFPEGDPQIHLDHLKGMKSSLEISAFFEDTNQAASRMMREHASLKKEIQQMKSTKVWKLYEKMKHHS